MWADVNDKQIDVQVLNQDYPKDYFDESSFNVQGATKKFQILKPNERSLVFKKAALIKQTKNWDHLLKDLLVLRAQNNTLDQLCLMYPELDRSSLSKLQSELKPKSSHVTIKK